MKNVRKILYVIHHTPRPREAAADGHLKIAENNQGYHRHQKHRRGRRPAQGPAFTPPDSLDDNCLGQREGYRQEKKIHHCKHELVAEQISVERHQRKGNDDDRDMQLPQGSGKSLRAFRRNRLLPQECVLPDRHGHGVGEDQDNAHQAQQLSRQHVDVIEKELDPGDKPDDKSGNGRSYCAPRGAEGP